MARKLTPRISTSRDKPGSWKGRVSHRSPSQFGGRAGMTPMMVSASPSTVSVRPITSGAASKRCRHSRSLMSRTGAFSSSSRRRSRPSSGCAPSAAKKPAVMRAPLSVSAPSGPSTAALP